MMVNTYELINSAYRRVFQTVRLDLCYFVLRGMPRVHTTKIRELEEGKPLFLSIIFFELSLLLPSNFATMRFEPESLHGANAGLNVARELMEKVKQKFPWISYGDLWTLAGVAAVQEMAGPQIPWRPGRIDGFAANATPDGRLPDAAQGAQHVRDVST